MATRFVNERTIASTKQFGEIAKDLDLDVTTLATAWSKQHDYVASTIVGVRLVEQMKPIIKAADLKLNDETLARIDKVSREIMYPMG